MIFIAAFAHGLGYNAIGFWFLMATNWFALSLYLLEKGKADKRQREINRYLKNKDLRILKGVLDERKRNSE